MSKRFPRAALAAALLVVPALSAAHADDRDLCKEGEPDLTCFTFAPGDHVLPQHKGPLATWYATLNPVSAATHQMVYGAQGYTDVWGTPSLTGTADGSVVVWHGTTDTLQVNGERGTIAVGSTDFHNQHSYVFMQRGDGAVFAEGPALVRLGRRTTVLAHYDGNPTGITLTDADRHLGSLAIVTDHPFKARRTAGGRTCLFWTIDSALCLEGATSATRRIPVHLVADGSLARVMAANGKPGAAKAQTAGLPLVVENALKAPVTNY